MIVGGAVWSNQSSFTGLFSQDNYIPPEIFDLILQGLDDISSSSLIDYLFLSTTLEKSFPSLHDRLRDRLWLVNCTQYKDDLETLWDSSQSTRMLSDGTNLSSMEKAIEFHNNRRLVFLIDDTTDLGSVLWGDNDLDIIYCGDLLAIGDTLMRLSSVCAPHGKALHLVVDSGESAVYSGKKMFGIFNSEFLLSPSFFRDIIVSFPRIQLLECDYMALDSFIYQSFVQTANAHEPMKLMNLLFDRYLNVLRFNFPTLKTMKFVKSTTSRDETCNFIDLSTLILKKFRSNRISLMNLFRVHSLINWNLPKLEQFSGHRFKFDETTMTGSPERWTVSLRDNLNLLHDMAINETIDATPYYRINLIPDGVKHTKIVNWIPIELNSSSNSFKTPILILKSNSLESLNLKLLPFEVSSITMIQGLFLPSLKILSLEQTKDQQYLPSGLSNRRGSIILTGSASAAASNNNDNDEDSFPSNPMNPITFSSWNELINCQVIQTHNSPKDCHYIFNIENLKKILPSINLKKSFNTFFDEQQRFLVV